MSNQLDRNRYYALVYGDPIARYYQDGIFFRANGSLISTGKTPSPEKELHEAAVVERPAQASGAHDRLNGMHVAKLKALAVKVSEATGTEHPELSGAGLKSRLVTYIAENTE